MQVLSFPLHLSSPFCCVALPLPVSVVARPGPALLVDNGKLGNISNGNATVKILVLK